jgi:hypothetical protein
LLDLSRPNREEILPSSIRPICLRGADVEQSRQSATRSPLLPATLRPTTRRPAGQGGAGPERSHRRADQQCGLNDVHRHAHRRGRGVGQYLCGQCARADADHARRAGGDGQGGTRQRHHGERRRSPGSAHYPLHRPVDRAALLHLPLHAPGIDPVEELVGKRGDLLGNVVLAHNLDAEASFPVRLLLKTDERVGRHRVRHFDRHVANAAQIVRLPAVDGLVTLGVMVGDQFQIDTYLRVLQKANVQANPAVVKSGIAGGRDGVITLGDLQAARSFR